MPVVTINPGAWTSVFTTVNETAFENQSPRELYLTTEATGGLGPKDGNLVPPYTDIVISGGKTVSAYAHVAPARIYHMDA